MSTNGILDFQGTNRATFVGANSNVVIDTVNASFGIGVDVNGPTSNLHVVGNAYVTSNMEVGTANLFVDTVNSRVGVGTSSPNSKLHVVGNAYVTSNMEVGTANLFVDTVNSRVGIGTSSPNSKLHVEGNVYVNSGHTGNALWSQTISGTSNVTGKNIAVDSNGNVYVTGYYKSTSTVSLGNGVTLPISSGAVDAFIVKYDTSGNALWYQTITGTSNDIGYGIAVDSNGNVYVSGYYRSTSTVSLGNNISLPISSAVEDVFIVKYNTSGNALWSQTIPGTTSTDIGYGIAVDSSGNVYVTGYYKSTSTVSLGNNISLPISSGNDAFIVKYDTSGNAMWYQTISGTTSTDTGFGIAVDSSGNVYVSGYYNSTSEVSLGNDVTLPVSTGEDAFIVKYDTSGNALWKQTISGTSGDRGHGIAVDSNGNIYVTGIYASTSAVSLGNGVTLPISSANDAFIVKYDTSGNAQWYQTISGTSNDTGFGIAVESNGSVYVTGSYNSTSTVSLGNGLTLPISSANDTFIVKYDTSGNARWYQTISATSGDRGNGIAVESNGSVYVTGFYNSTSPVSLGNGLTLPISSADDAFIVKYEQPPVIFTTGSGRIGVGTSTPGAELHVVGNAHVTSNMEVGTANLFVDTVNSRVGVGTDSPNATLHIKNETDSSGVGDVYISGVIKKPTECLRLQNKWHNTGSGALLRFTNQHPQGTNPSTGEYNLAGIAGYDHDGGWGGGLAFYTSPGTGSGGDDLTLRMSINSTGAVNIPGPTTGASHSDGGILYLLDTPIIDEWSWTGPTANTLRITYASTELPANCKAVLAEVFMPKSNNVDHVGHSLGKNYSSATTWTSGNQQPSTRFTLNRQTTFLDMRGDSDNFEYYYGKWFSSVIIPLDTGNTVYHIVAGESPGTSSWVYVVTRGYYI